MGIDPSLGGTFLLGSRIAFVVRPDRPGTLVFLNISSDGKVSVLYPASRQEAEPLPPGQAFFMPGKSAAQRIVVREPVGMDLQFALMFDEPPPGLERLFHARNMTPDDSRLLALESSLKAASGKFTFATSSLRTIGPR